MAHNTNSFERFWKELKRRKVVHVITVYAATAFVILELVDMVSQPLHFPEWTQGFIIVLLCIGFVIALFLSWIYDITPAGVKKTKQVSAIKPTDQTTHEVSSGWKMATYISAVIIVALVAFNFIHRRNLNADISKLEKSIAVIPFRNDSPDTTNAYFINGIMERITTNLQMIKKFRVIGRTSVEQYRNNKAKSISEIAKELGVNYIIEGSGQRYGNSFSLVVQLLKAKGKENHLWAKTYDQEIKEVNDYINIESEIAQRIAAELKAAIAPEEKQLIEKTPSGSLTAYDFYQRGIEELKKFGNDNSNRPALQKAEDFFYKALKYDSSFAQAYTGLANVYWGKHYWDEYFSKKFIDSVLILCDIALTYDNYLAEAHFIKGEYYSEEGNTKRALEEYDKTIKINPNDWQAYYKKGSLSDDIVEKIENYYEAASRYHGSELPELLRRIASVYFEAGFYEKSNSYELEALKLDNDSCKYLVSLAFYEWDKGNYKKSLELGEKAGRIDSTCYPDMDRWAGNMYMYQHNYKESLKYYKKYISRMKASGELIINEMHRIGYTYLRNGYKKEAEYYFNKQIENCNNLIKSDRPSAQQLYPYYDLAGIYAVRGNKAKAYENLKIFNRNQSYDLWIVSLIKNDPLFDSIRGEPEFQQIVRDIEAKYQAKYQAEHERVKKWLEEQGMLN
jgi:TolB-like protein